MISVTFKEGETTATVTDDVWQWDFGQELQINGLDLPEKVDVDFAFGNNGSFESNIVTGHTEEGVTTVSVPDDMFAQSKTKDYPVYIYIFESDDYSGETTYIINMTVKTRPKR